MKNIIKFISKIFAAARVVAVNMQLVGVHPDGVITEKSGAALPLQNALVKYDDAGNAVAAGAADIPVGAVNDTAEAAGEYVGVSLLGSRAGTVVLVASAAIAKGAKLAPAAGGKVKTAAAAEIQVGVAVTSASADGDEIEVAHNAPFKLPAA